MLLADKVAVVYGASGPIGSAVARAYAAHGARLFLSSRDIDHVRAVGAQLKLPADRLQLDQVDALDEQAVDRYVKSVVERAGRIDISFNAIGVDDVQGTPLLDMKLEDFLQPIRNAAATQFITSRAAGKQMVKQRSGVILTFGGGGARAPVKDYNIGGFHVAMAAVDTFRRQLASEIGKYNVRVVTIETGGVLETIPDVAQREEIAKQVVGDTMLKRAATFEDVGNAAVFAASDMARCLTATTLNITAGAAVD